MSRESRVLSPEMENDFVLESGMLHPLLHVCRVDRDLVLECRGACAAIYCKGQRLDIRSCVAGGYAIKADKAFLEGPYSIRSKEDAETFVKEQLPFVKQRMATHRSCGMEIEFQQLIIRANNTEPGLQTDYFAVDQQVVLAEGLDRLDVLGIYWPAAGRRFDTDVALALIEVKFALSGGVEGIAEQTLGYYSSLADNIEDVAAEAEALLRQKLRLGLITGASKEALQKLATLPVSRDPKRVKIVLALVDYNPRSTRFNPAALSHLSGQVEIFRQLGLGLWEGNAEQLQLRTGATA